MLVLIIKLLQRNIFRLVYQVGLKTKAGFFAGSFFNLKKRKTW